MAFNSGIISYNEFDDDSLSDDDGNTSSEDEIDIILHGTPKQRRKLKFHQSNQLEENKKKQGPHSGKPDSHSSSEDEFEKEMNAELNQQVKDRNKVLKTSVSGQPTNKKKDFNKTQASKAPDKFYDEIYFDSDEEDDTTDNSSSRKKTHIVISNDELLYDPDMDDEDQEWVDKQRQSHIGLQAVGQKRGKKLKMPNSDAMLDCPACLTTLCLDCQRHETYKHQFRAMFVMNCVIDKSETLQCPEHAPKKKKKKKQASQNSSSTINDNPQASDMFNPVRCTECNTVVGVADNDEVYHFFNVLASHT